MLTKLIVLIIVLNVIGSFFKRRQEKKRKEELMAQGGVPPSPPDEEEAQTRPMAAQEPGDLFAALLGGLDGGQEGSGPAANTGYSPETDETPKFTSEPEKIRSGQSLVDAMTSAKEEPVALIKQVEGSDAMPELPDEAKIDETERTASVTVDKTMGPSRLFSRGGLRQGVVYHEILGTPKGLL
jgi:hypothetical protein